MYVGFGSSDETVTLRLVNMTHVKVRVTRRVRLYYGHQQKLYFILAQCLTHTFL